MINLLKQKAHYFLHRIVCYIMIFSYMIPVINIPIIVHGNDLSSVSDQKNMTVDHAPNGAQIINISPPNRTGVSHNKFLKLNVDEKGMVLNNSLIHGRSNLGGQILGNPNLSDKTASLIINEVTGTGNSILKGYTEIFGDKADYILANPNGIICRGCGFINTRRATLSTGRPQFDDNGQLYLDVEKGSIEIQDSLKAFGLDAKNLDYFDIVSRTAQINGKVFAKNALISVGRQTYDYKNKTGEGKKGDGSKKPEFILDSSLIGGIYADHIKLIGTEAGVGVRAPQNMSMTMGDMILTTEGDLVLRSIDVEKGGLKATSNSGKISLGANNKITAAEDVVLLAEKNILAEKSTIIKTPKKINIQSITGSVSKNENSFFESETQISLSANQDILNQGVMKAKNIDLNSGSRIENKGLMTSENGIKVQAKKLINEKTIYSDGNIIIHGDIDNQLNASLHSDKKLMLDHAEKISNTGLLKGLKGLVLKAKSLFNRGNIAIYGDEVNITLADKLENTGTIESDAKIEIRSDSYDNQGTIKSDSDITINTTGAEFKNKTLETNGVLTIDTDADITHTGQLTGLSGLILKAKSYFGTGDVNGDVVDIAVSETFKNEGQIVSDSALTLSSKAFDNQGTIKGKSDVTVKTSGADLKSKTLDADGVLTIETRAKISNTGLLKGLKGLVLKARSLFNMNKAIIHGKKTDITLTDLLNNEGHIQSEEKLTIITKELNNQSTIVSKSDIIVNSENVTTKDLSAGGMVSVDSKGDIRNLGELTGLEKIVIKVKSLFNIGEIYGDQIDIDLKDELKNEGLIQSDSDMDIKASAFNNLDTIVSQSNMDITSGAQFTNKNLHSNGTLRLIQMQK